MFFVTYFVWFLGFMKNVWFLVFIFLQIGIQFWFDFLI
jgi:hypothetical protein